MIRMPNSGIATSTNTHNSDLTVTCDWLECCVLLGEEEISRSDARDVLLEEQIYDDQDFADEFLESVWSELRQRVGWLGGSSPLDMTGDRIEPKKSVDNATAQAFMLAVSLGPQYSGWSKAFGTDYREQGELFERLVEDSARVLFPDWTVHRTGWSSDITSKLDDVLNKLANAIGATVGDSGMWASPSANECGLDLVWYRPFSDSRPSIPIFLAQCASGANWTRKLNTPNLNVWRELIKFPQTPGRVFTIPFALDSQEHLRRSNEADAVLLDRYRLLHAGTLEPGWESPDFRTRASAWLEDRIAWLLKD